jgi:glycosyltransferase involved in cell wall biosynthesis
VKFSIVTVCRNAEKTIDATLRSVAEQDYPHVEQIVIDGASTDGTLAAIEKYRDRLAYFVSEPDGGIFDAMNKGVRAATGDYLLFLNADDTLFNASVLRRAAEKLAALDVDFAYGAPFVVTADPARSFVKWFPPVDKWFLHEDTINHQSMFIRRTAFDVCGLYDTRYKICADYAWQVDAILNKKLRFAPLGMIVPRYSLGGLSANPAALKRHYAERRLIQKIYFGRRELWLCNRRLFRWLMRLPAFAARMRRAFAWNLLSCDGAPSSARGRPS